MPAATLSRDAAPPHRSHDAPPAGGGAGASRRERVVVWLALLLFAAASVVGSGAAGPIALAPMLLLVAVAADTTLRFEARAVAMLALGATAVTATQLPAVWPLAQLVVGAPALLLLLASKQHAALRARWLRLGRFEPLPVVLLALLAALALFAWTRLFAPDLSGALRMLPDWPLPLMLAGALGFSLLNAVLEEVMFRGLLQGALAGVLRAAWLGVLLQGAAFGVMHAHGVPSGLIGVLMAGGWGMLLGWARLRSDGLLTPVLAHVVADAVIFALLATAP